MSGTTALGVIPNQRPTYLQEFRNSHGWAPSIWSRLLKAHGYNESWIVDDSGLNRLWTTIEELPEWQQVPLVLTFDTGVIPWQAFGQAADLLEEFERQVPENPGYANHVPAMAALLRSGPEVPLFGVYGTSVSENPFDPWDEEADDVGSGIGLEAMYVLPIHREHLRAFSTRSSGSPTNKEQ